MTRFSNLCAVFAVLAALMIWPEKIQSSNYLYLGSPDHTSYISHGTAIVFGGFPTYKDEYTNGIFPGNYSIGPSLAASPFMFAFSLADRYQGRPIVEKRTRAEAAVAWTPLGFTFASLVAFFVGLWFSWKACLEARGEWPGLSVFLAVTAGGVPHYAMREPISSHSYEFAGVACLLYLLMAVARGSRVYSASTRWSMIGAGAALYLFRYNDVLFSGVYVLAGLVLMNREKDEATWGRWRRDLLEAALALGTVVFLSRLLIKVTMGDRPPWDFWMPHHLSEQFLHWKGLRYYGERLVHMFIGKDWGLLYLATPLLLGLAMIVKVKPRWLVLALLIPAAANFSMALSWSNQGAGYGYRYFTPSVAPLAAVGLSLWLAGSSRWYWRQWTALLIGLFPVACLLSIGTDFLWIDNIKTRWGMAWTHESFVHDVARFILTEPLALAHRIYAKSGLTIMDEQWSRLTRIKWALLMAVPVLAWLLAFFRELRRSREVPNS